MTLSALSVLYYRHNMKWGIARFERFVRMVWDVPAEGKSERELAEMGVETLGKWIREISTADSHTGLGISKDMLEELAGSGIPVLGGYRMLDRAGNMEVFEKRL